MDRTNSPDTQSQTTQQDTSQELRIQPSHNVHVQQASLDQETTCKTSLNVTQQQTTQPPISG